MRVKVGDIIGGHRGEYRVVKLDHPRTGRVQLVGADGGKFHFDVDRHHLHKLGKKRRFWHRWFK